MFGLDFIKKLKPAEYQYKDKDQVCLGFIAQDLEEIVPKETYNFVDITHNGVLFVNYAEFIAPMVKAIQELDEEVTRLREEIKCKSK